MERLPGDSELPLPGGAECEVGKLVGTLLRPELEPSPIRSSSAHFTLVPFKHSLYPGSLLYSSLYLLSPDF